MLVYGDPQFPLPAAALATRLRLLGDDPDRSPDAWRKRLIQAGQAEQSWADHCLRNHLPDTNPIFTRLRACTDAAADAFCSEGANSDPKLFAELSRAACDGLASAPEALLTVKVPEGFEFYSLYPEQYLAAARQWAMDHRAEGIRTVLVVGVLSIGTSLSAVVGAALRREGWQVRRTVVRPQGHPFHREVQLNQTGTARREEWAIIADEGPGMSGSSMAAVGRALMEAGFAPERVFAFPSHGGEPGSAAAPEVKQWWATVRKYVVSPNQLRWSGRSLEETLQAATHKALGEPVQAWHDMGGGLWRQVAFPSEDAWPAAAVGFERSKYLGQDARGMGCLWKHAGLGSLLPQTVECASAIPPIQVDGLQCRRPPAAGPGCLGFECRRWMGGTRLSAEAGSDPRLRLLLVRYALAVRGAPLSEQETTTGMERLAEMLRCNAREGLGEAVADRAARLGEEVHLEAGARAFGDGRMAPENWIRATPREFYKPETSARCDHTLVGAQPWLWDLAGLGVEWGIAADYLEQLARQAAPDAREVTGVNLRFYCAAYAAFRMGLCHMAAYSGAGGDRERMRLSAARERYAGALGSLLRADL